MDRGGRISHTYTMIYNVCKILIVAWGNSNGDDDDDFRGCAWLDISLMNVFFALASTSTK